MGLGLASSFLTQKSKEERARQGPRFPAPHLTIQKKDNKLLRAERTQLFNDNNLYSVVVDDHNKLGANYINTSTMTTSPSNSSSSSLRRSSRTRRPAHTVYDDAAALGAETGSGKKRKVYVVLQTRIPALVVDHVVLTCVWLITCIGFFFCIAVMMTMKKKK